VQEAKTRFIIATRFEGARDAFSDAIERASQDAASEPTTASIASDRIAKRVRREASRRALTSRHAELPAVSGGARDHLQYIDSSHLCDDALRALQARRQGPSTRPAIHFAPVSQTFGAFGGGRNRLGGARSGAAGKRAREAQEPRKKNLSMAQ